MPPITVTRELHLPDELRVARAENSPHLGPRILFFSGGSALNGISRQLKRYTFNSMHLITPFDSGGSSQELRRAFDMPAVGDLRSRLMALADETVLGQPDIYALFSYRLDRQGDQAALRAELERMRAGRHPLMTAVARPMRQLIQGHLGQFLEAAPPGFDYRNASIGNLILAGGYLANDRALEPVLFLMSKMVDARGTLRAVVDDTLHLGAELADGRRVIGQREISGKEVAPLPAPIRRCFLAQDGAELPPGQVKLPKRNRRLIEEADVICYPPGSLYSSVIANLLPRGVGRAIARRRGPKIYLPSLGQDPEAQGHDLADQVAALLAPMQADAGTAAAAPSDLISHVICDSGTDAAACAAVTTRHGIPCHRLPLAGPEPGKYDAGEVARLLISLA
ncbi:GAK system CofD-like protein [Pseudooceanicola sp. 200-1SW]|uniref:GAK system CofD-like protein n=1 Tax=Pseudooceanicola sp. 200-1SW TaxID=3425949 RepID=UPI003D7FC8D5